MNQVRISILWKFFAITGLISIILTALIAGHSISQQKEILVQQAVRHISLVASIASSSIQSSDIDSSLQINSMQTGGFERINRELNRQYQIFTQSAEQFKIANISVLIPGKNKACVFFTTQIPFQFLDNTYFYPEIETVMQHDTIQIKRNFVESDQHYYAAFSPVYNSSHQIVAIVRVDIRNADIFGNAPEFWRQFGIYIALSLFLSFVISLILSRVVTRQIDRFVSFVNRVSEGNYHLRYEYRTFDEMEKIAYALNIMLEKLEGLIESEADRNRLQKQITELLRHVSAAADGDFTVKAEVTADTLGALADSFNLMIAELGNLISDMQKASERISISTDEILKSSEVMTVGANKQAKDIESTYNDVKNMVDIIKYANDRSTQTARAATRATEVALRGTEIVKKSIEGMHRIRETVQETARRVKVLGENSQEIGEILEVISDIANRTNLLGLNATIEAARASEAGRGFAVVADEVRNLAERSSQAAKDIAELVENIQAGTKEAVTAMEHGTMEVEKETKRVDGAGSALKEILENTQESAKLVNEISEAFQHQEKASSNIANAMESIASIAQRTAEGAQKSKKLSEEMASLSRILNVAVAKFRLPKKHNIL